MAKQAGEGWSARCPAHDDRRASLSRLAKAKTAGGDSIRPMPLTPRWLN